MKENKKADRYRCSNSKCVTRKYETYDLTYSGDDYKICINCGCKMWRMTEHNIKKKGK